MNEEPEDLSNLSQEELLKKADDVLRAGADIQHSLRKEFVSTWAESTFVCPAIFIDWNVIWDMMYVEYPDALGTWNSPLEATPELEAILGGLAPAFAHFVTLSRKYAVSHQVNIYTQMGYLEMIFDSDTMSEAYRATTVAKDQLPEDSFRGLEKIIEAYEAF